MYCSRVEREERQNNLVLVEGRGARGAFLATVKLSLVHALYGTAVGGLLLVEQGSQDGVWCVHVG